MDETEDSVKFAKRSVNEHKKLLKLIKKGNIPEAVDCLAGHLEYQCKRIEALFSNSNPPAAGGF
jgi:DNA-binding GntR family transcriptional regulator